MSATIFNLQTLFAVRRDNAELSRSYAEQRADTNLEHEVTVAWNEFLDSTAALCAAQKAMDEAHRKYIEASKQLEARR